MQVVKFVFVCNHGERAISISDSVSSFLDGKTCEEIKVNLHAVYKDHHAPLMTAIRYWFNEFKRGRSSVFDEERTGCSIEITTADMVSKIHDIVLADRWVKIREIADTIDISTECIQNILHEKLGMRKLSARWVPREAKMESHDNFGALLGQV